MEKIFTFLKKNYLITVFMLIFLILIVCLIVFTGKKGTYGATASHTVTLDCPTKAKAGAEVSCTIKLSSSSTILSVNANYTLPSGVTYVSFSENSSCSGTNCFVSFVTTENGFAVINENNGVASPSAAVIGTVKFLMPASAAANATYTVGLNTVELCDSSYAMISVSNATDTITIEEDSLSFDNSLTVDETNHVIKRLKLGTTATTLKGKVTTSGTKTITSGGTTVANSSAVKTGDILKVTYSGGSSVSYTITVLGDVTGTGDVQTNDVGTLYRHVKGKTISGWTEYSMIAGDIDGNGTIATNDVGILYRYLKGKITSLEGGQ